MTPNDTYPACAPSGHSSTRREPRSQDALPSLPHDTDQDVIGPDGSPTPVQPPASTSTPQEVNGPVRGVTCDERRQCLRRRVIRAPARGVAVQRDDEGGRRWRRRDAVNFVVCGGTMLGSGRVQMTTAEQGDEGKRSCTETVRLRGGFSAGACDAADHVATPARRVGARQTLRVATHVSTGGNRMTQRSERRADKAEAFHPATSQSGKGRPDSSGKKRGRAWDFFLSHLHGGFHRPARDTKRRCEDDFGI